jgi:hypothetical protein
MESYRGTAVARRARGYWTEQRGSTGSGDSAGLRLVASGPEAWAQQMKLRQTNGSTASSPSSTSRPGPRFQP